MEIEAVNGLRENVRAGAKAVWSRRYSSEEGVSPYFSLLNFLLDNGKRFAYPAKLHKAYNLYKSKDQRNVVFIWIPKTAGTSLWRLLDSQHCQKHKDLYSLRHCFSQRGMVTFGHMSYLELLRSGYIKREFHESSFKFCFVRNPFDRVVSIYAYLKRLGVVHMNASFESFVRLLGEGALDKPGLYNRRGMSQCSSQLDWITDDSGEIFVDFIGRYENIDKDVSFVMKKLGVKDSLPILNRTDHRPYRSYYTPELRAIVEEVYRVELETLSYSF